MPGIAVGTGNDSHESWTHRRNLSVKYIGVIYKGMNFLPKKIAVISW